MEPASQLLCGTNCIIHLHSAAGLSFLRRRRIHPFQQIFDPDDRSPISFRRTSDPPLRLPFEIFSLYLARMKRSINLIHNHILRHILIVLPTAMNTPHIRYRLSITAATLGIHIPLFLERSTAAAAFYPPLSPDHKIILVFELTDHILEISIIIAMEGRRNLRVRCAVTDTGCPLFHQMVNELPWWLNISIRDNADSLLRFHAACERAKDDLCSGAAAACIRFEEQGREANIQISREYLVDMNLSHLRNSIAACLEEARIWKESVDEIVLAGASIFIPEVRGMLQEFFGEKPYRCDIDPVDVVSIGAVRFGDSISAALNSGVFPVVILNYGVFLV